jgi:DNA-binding PadR family transcriptional regulator
MRRHGRDTFTGDGFDPFGGRIQRHPEGGRGGPYRRRRGRPGGNRARRGDVRAAALTLLSERPMHGYEIIQELESRSGGVWKPSPGSVYPTLQLLADEGLVTADEVEGRRVFTLTESGREQVATRAADGGIPPWVEMADDAGEPVQRMARALRSVVVASKQLLHDGSPTQQSRAEVILADTRRRLYGLLADDEDVDASTQGASDQA